MKYAIALVSTLVVPLLLHAEELLKHVPMVQEPMTITAAADKKMHRLTEITDPGIAAPAYALRGRIRYENVAGDAFLQMDNHFGELGTFFTKSLAASGPLARISGSSDWRPFVLPFYVNSGEGGDNAAARPEKLTLSLYLPGAGTVSISQVGLYQYAGGEDPLRHGAQAGVSWFDNRSAGLIGAVGGTVLGLWGALIGILSSRGKARVFAVGSANAILVLGIVAVVFGGVAMAAGQPYAVYYTLLLLGGIAVFVMAFLRRSVAARYEEVELKRMRSMDV